MATSSSPYMSTEETTNANRTSRLILGPCTDELRDVLRHFVPPQTFPHVIKQKANTSSLSRLTGPQMNLISPRNGTYTGNYEDMDISLLYALLRNICGIPPHSKGWGNDPDPTDCSPSACIETIRLARNRCVHSCIPSLSNIEFSHIWSTVRAAVVNLDNFLKNGCKYEREVDFLRHETMDPVRDQHYQEELRKQVEEDLETREMLTNFKRKYEEDAEIVEKKVKRLEEEIECPVPQNIKALHNLDLKKWEEEDTFYQETHSFSSMMQKVKDQPYVIFVGVPGSGKSATARHIALKLKSENYQVLPIKDIRKLEDFCDTNNPQVFVMEDALGVYGLQQSELNIILRYKERIITPMNENSKLLLTCREIVFNEVLCHNVFLAEDNNVIKLCNSEHDLNDNDKKLILKKYGLDEDLMTRSELRSASRMFPLLCKLFAKDLKLRSLGSKFFIMPVQCFLEELDKMRSENKINYATLILCMMNGDMLSKEILRDKNNAEFIEMKTVVLESCRVESHTDTFKFMDALSAMKGTYTRENDTVFSFIHDYIYEICAFHYGQQFLDQVLLYLDSCYIANYVRPKDVEASTSSTGEKSFDLCLRLNEGQYLMFAERLYRDIQDLDLHDVFMNNSLKHPQVIQAFINVLERKSYTELKSIFLQKQGRGLPHLLSKVRDLIKETQMQTNEEIERERDSVCCWMRSGMLKHTRTTSE
ncbi:uncharacterized protein LOC134242354 [Saccostrea cucullata]|uniref:uncharacterized protein LOC134242354 n=1 Tax=Saccostrea cuccullata TaxID=36930 RepID=UPI002ED21ADF